MAIIRAKGLYEGERLAACSDEAQLHWPRLYLLGNGDSRFEVNYARIIAVVYASFHRKPTEEEVRGWIREYSDNFLLFIYEDPTTGAMWAQWITAKENLATYRTAEDKRCPAPDDKEIDAYRQAYIEHKRLKYRKTRDIFKPLETVENHFAKSRTASVGVGVGVGDGDGIGEGSFNGVPPFSAVAERFTPSLRFAEETRSYEKVLSASADDANSFSEDENKNSLKKWTLEDYVGFWNKHAVAFPQVRKLTPKRRAKLTKRIKDGLLTPERFATAIRLLHKSDFCLGDNTRSWRASFDFIINESKLVGVLEGSYLRRGEGDDDNDERR